MSYYNLRMTNNIILVSLQGIKRFDEVFDGTVIPFPGKRILGRKTEALSLGIFLDEFTSHGRNSFQGLSVSFDPHLKYSKLK